MINNRYVRDFVNDKVPRLHSNDTVQHAATFMSKQKEGTIAIVDDDNKIEGTLSFAEVIKALRLGIDLNQQVKNIMVRDIPYCYEDSSLDHLTFKESHTLLVLDRSGRLKGKLDATEMANGSTKMLKHIQALERMMERFKICFDTAYEGITVVDREGYIRLFNESYARYVGMSREEAIGKHCTEVIENTRLPIVMETGIPERNQPHTLQGVPMIVHRLPVWKEDEIIGAVGMLIFEGVSELYDTDEKVQRFKRKKEGERIYFGVPQSLKENAITFDHIIGSSPTVTQLKIDALKAAKTTGTILVTGESGVGKEMFVKAIHRASPVRNGPLISINCAAIPDELAESELFGYEHGAFTGAKQGGKPGKFELAHEGTLFLDEIGDLPLHLQAKLLRVLEEQKIERVGGTKEIWVKARIIAATNQPLEKQISEGKFREDLYYRLHILALHIPPLRERKVDIPMLVSYLLEKACKKYSVDLVEMSQQAVIAFIRYRWPGNVRELANLLERLVIMTDKKRIDFEDLPPYIQDSYVGIRHEEMNTKKKGRAEEGLSETEENNLLNLYRREEAERERELILSVLQQTNGNKTEASKNLGIHRSTLYKKLKKLDLV